ncbi:MAG TPA: hypothetical protein VKZ49_14210 [Polyangiaceae bacterium]|nr:hypothetical protein [Polyangiaceae bacterium]
MNISLRLPAAWMAAALAALGCADLDADGPSLAKRRSKALRAGEHVPNISEASAAGLGNGRIRRSSPAFSKLVTCNHPGIVFKDEERTGADRIMSPRLRTRLIRLAGLVAERWPGVELRVTEAWDEDGEHGARSLHYDGRAADLTTSDLDASKLGELGYLAVKAKLDWVYFEDRSHVHVSVNR